MTLACPRKLRLSAPPAEADTGCTLHHRPKFSLVADLRNIHDVAKSTVYKPRSSFKQERNRYIASARSGATALDHEALPAACSSEVSRLAPSSTAPPAMSLRPDPAPVLQHATSVLLSAAASDCGLHIPTLPPSHIDRRCRRDQVPPRHRHMQPTQLG